MQTFQKMIEDYRVRLNKGLQTISEALSEGGKIYKSCLILPKFTLDIDKKISVFQGKLDGISQSFDSNVSLTSSIEGQVMTLIDQILILNIENDRILRQFGELQNLITPQMDTKLNNNVDCMKTMTQPVLSELKDVEIYAYVFSAFITILDNLKTRWDTHLGFFKKLFVDIFKHVQKIQYLPQLWHCFQRGGVE